MEDILNKRVEKVKSFLFSKSRLIVYLLLSLIIWISFKLRISNLGLLKDVTTGDYICIELDCFAFIRYANYILDHGRLLVIDKMRYFPLGFSNVSEFSFLSYFDVYLYKFLNIFSSSITLNKAIVLYPPLTFAISLVFFFLLVRNLFDDDKIALLATAFLAVIPLYLHRTMAGFSDKEALALMFMYIGMYFYVKSMKINKLKFSLILAGFSGLFIGFMGLVWGGVNFVFLIIGGSATIELLLGKFEKKDIYSYSLFVIITLTLLSVYLPNRYNISTLTSSLTSSIMLFALLVSILDLVIYKLDIFKIKTKLESKYPKGLVTFVIASILAIIYTSIIIEPLFVINVIKSSFKNAIFPLMTRWGRTVAESHQPYIRDLIGNIGKIFFWMFMAGSIWLFYSLTTIFKKYRIKATIFYTLFILSFVFSRYSPESKVLNGSSKLAQLLYLGSLVIFLLCILIFYVYLYYKDRETFESISKIESSAIFVLIWFLVMVMGAKTAVRFFILLAPIAAILASYFIVKIFNLSLKLKQDFYKISILALIFLIVLWPASFVASFIPIAGSIPLIKYDGILPSYYNSISSTAKYSGPGFNQQWQIAMDWVRKNTDKDAVFAHWWDYGYWVQTGGKRATITDGGNAIGYWNYLMGRHVLTGQSDEEALKFLKAHNASYLLMVSDEIGKYPAFSSIGSDVDYDRYSWINIFNLDQSKIQESRNGTMYLYTGGTTLDDDLIYQRKLFPRQSAGIAGFFVSIEQTDEQLIFNQPIAILVYNGQQFNIPVECLFFNKEEINFGMEGLKGCLIMIPNIQNQQLNPIGSALWLSEDVRKSRFGQYYIMGKDSEYFKLVYSDDDKMPLAVFNGRLIGPLKIWSIKYPADIDVDDSYLLTYFPDRRLTDL